MELRNFWWIALLVLSFIFVACGGQENVEPVQMVHPPMQVPDTLEEQFDMLRPDDDGTVTSVAWSRDFPDSFPNESFSFSTHDRFSISYSLRVVVADPNYSLDLLHDFPRVGDVHINHRSGRISTEITLSIPHEDVENVFQTLYSMGIVMHYFVEIWDVIGLSEEQKQPQWQTNSTITVLFIMEN